MQLKNDLILRAAMGESVERTPVWLMRQAGRILPQYRAVRSSLSGFKELVETPERAAEVTIQPVDELGVDAAIIFSDILVIPDAMGLPYQIKESVGPVFSKRVESRADIDGLKIVEPEKDLSYVLEAIKCTKRDLMGRVPLIGFAGAPLTIFSYMIEGGGSKTFSHARRMLYKSPKDSVELLQMITDSTIEYLKAQIKAGVDLVQLFDSWAGIYEPEQYQEFGLSFIAQICEALKADPETAETPITVFAKGAHESLPEIAHTCCNVIGLDWNISVNRAIELAQGGHTLQGNLDPCVLYGSKELVRAKTQEMLNAFSGHSHIANLGHGVYPDTPLENVKVFVDTVKEFRHHSVESVS